MVQHHRISSYIHLHSENMSNTQQSGNGQNQQPQGGTTPQRQQKYVILIVVVRLILTVLTSAVGSHHSQSTRNGGEQLWNSMNARVGNQNARPIDPRLVAQAVGHIQGVVPTATRNQVQQVAQGDHGLVLLVAVPLTAIQEPADNPISRWRHNHRR
jgi:hypothetical protein